MELVPQAISLTTKHGQVFLLCNHLHHIFSNESNQWWEGALHATWNCAMAGETIVMIFLVDCCVALMNNNVKISPLAYVIDNLPKMTKFLPLTSLFGLYNIYFCPLLLWQGQ